jgi:hypothetical protein
MDQLYIATVSRNVMGYFNHRLSPCGLYLATKPVYCRCLPLLGVQRHIEIHWKTLPKPYQGISLPNFALLSLASKLALIQCIWGFKDAVLMPLPMGYESFVMDIGMYGNALSLNYDRFSILATNGTWFKTHGSSSTNSRQLLCLAPTLKSTLSETVIDHFFTYGSVKNN